MQSAFGVQGESLLQDISRLPLANKIIRAPKPPTEETLEDTVSTRVLYVEKDFGAKK